MSAKPLPEYNIAFLGESGVGKSITINSFANYLKHANLEEAQTNGFVQPVPTKFSLPDPISDNLIVFQSGESQKDVSQPMAYSFEFGDRVIRMIDTPAVGKDTELNLEKIFNYLASYKELHAIFIVVKSTTTELSSDFRSVVTELFARLDESAFANIIFCFTYSRISLYRPSESFATVNEFFSNQFGGAFKLNTEENCCFIENEPYRFLVAKRDGYPFLANEAAAFKESWDRSAEQAEDIFLNIFELDPFCLKNVRKIALNPQSANVNDSLPIIEEIESEGEELFKPSEKMIFKVSKPMAVLSKPPVKLPEYNILLLGETGAGKSTTINAFANYLKYSSFEEASAGDFVELIPSKFTLPHPVSGEPMVIKSGEDKNEQHGDGNSSTQDPVCYQFRFGGGLIRLIDTPGMGDTTGVDVDKLNFDKILAHLNHYETLHGICILLKSTETRKAASFRYCINELLTHLHKSACENIVFCFTFSRNFFYGPGEGFSTLRGFLRNELKEVNLDLKSGVNCFYIDNEAYRFLVAKKQDYPFKAKQESSYRESWETSVEQTEEMIDRIIKAQPHKLKETCSLNNARQLILELAEPMVKLQANINANISHIKAEEQRIKTSDETLEELARNLNLEVDDLEMKELPYPATVCIKASCTEVVNFQGTQKINYKTRCHPHCYLTGVTVNTIGHPDLRNCAAMNGPNCHVCGCQWEVHMYQTCEYFKVKRTVIDSNKQKEIKTVEDAKIQIDKGIKTMRQLVAEYEAEFDVIHKVSSKFAFILIDNSNTPYNRFIEPYLNLLIDEEQKKMAAIDNYPRTAYDSLIKMKDTHRENVRILTQAIKSKSRDNVRIEDITKFRDQLFQLKHSGPQFHQMLGVTKSSQKKHFQHWERDPMDFIKRTGPLAVVSRNQKKKNRRNKWYQLSLTGGGDHDDDQYNQSKKMVVKK